MTGKGLLELNRVVLRLRLGTGAEEVISDRDVLVDLGWTGVHTEGAHIDYEGICRVLSGFNGRSYGYIEELTSDILREVVRELPEGRWRVTVHKMHPPSLLPMESASYTLEGGLDA